MLNEECLPEFSFRFREVNVKEEDQETLKRITDAEDQLMEKDRTNQDQNAEQPSTT
jgi:hypothetical protein